MRISPSKCFYWIAGAVLAVALGHVGLRLSNSWQRDPDPSSYIFMAPEARAAELRALEAEIAKKDDVTPERYFKVLARFEVLNEAMERAALEEPGGTSNPSRSPDPRNDTFKLDFLQQDWVNLRDNEWSGGNIDYKEVERAREAAGLDDPRKSHLLPMDPLLPRALAIFYIVGLLLTLVHFSIRIEKMGGCWWRDALPLVGDWRLPMWAMIWFVGVFKYPTEIDVLERAKLVTARAYRFAVFLLSSAISLAGAGCATKRINTEPEVRPDATKSWQLNIDTATLPKYIGGNGAVFHPEPVQQTSITATAANGFYANLWHSAALDGRELKPNFGSELDGAIGWSGKTRGFGVDTSLTWVGVTPLRNSRGDVLQFSVSVSRTLPYGLGASSTLNAVIPVSGLTPRRGTFFRESLNWSTSFGRASISTGGEIFHDSGAFGFQSGWFARGSTSIALRLGQHWKASVPIMWNAPLSTVSDGRRKELQGGLIVSWQP